MFIVLFLQSDLSYYYTYLFPFTISKEIVYNNIQFFVHKYTKKMFVILKKDPAITTQ